MPNDRGYNGDGGRYIREDDDRRYGGRRGSSYEDDSYSRRYSDGASNRNTWTEGARSAQGRSNQTFSGRDYEDIGDYRGGMAGEDRYGRERWGERRNEGERYQDTSRYGRSGEESRYGNGHFANEEAARNRARGYGDSRYASSDDRDYYERRDNGGFVGDVKRAVRGAVRGVRDFFDDDEDDRRYADRRSTDRDWESDDRSRRNAGRDDDYRYGRSRYDGRDHRNY